VAYMFQAIFYTCGDADAIISTQLAMNEPDFL